MTCLVIVYVNTGTLYTIIYYLSYLVTLTIALSSYSLIIMR